MKKSYVLQTIVPLALATAGMADAAKPTIGASSTTGPGPVVKKASAEEAATAHNSF